MLHRLRVEEEELPAPHNQAGSRSPTTTTSSDGNNNNNNNNNNNINPLTRIVFVKRVLCFTTPFSIVQSSDLIKKDKNCVYCSNPVSIPTLLLVSYVSTSFQETTNFYVKTMPSDVIATFCDKLKNYVLIGQSVAHADFARTFFCWLSVFVKEKPSVEKLLECIFEILSNNKKDKNNKNFRQHQIIFRTEKFRDALVMVAEFVTSNLAVKLWCEIIMCLSAGNKSFFATEEIRDSLCNISNVFKNAECEVNVNSGCSTNEHDHDAAVCLWLQLLHHLISNNIDKRKMFAVENIRNAMFVLCEGKYERQEYYCDMPYHLSINYYCQEVYYWMNCLIFLSEVNPRLFVVDETAEALIVIENGDHHCHSVFEDPEDYPDEHNKSFESVNCFLQAIKVLLNIDREFFSSSAKFCEVFRPLAGIVDEQERVKANELKIETRRKMRKRKEEQEDDGEENEEDEEEEEESNPLIDEDIGRLMSLSGELYATASLKEQTEDFALFLEARFGDDINTKIKYCRIQVEHSKINNRYHEENSILVHHIREVLGYLDEEEDDDEEDEEEEITTTSSN